MGQQPSQSFSRTKPAERSPNPDQKDGVRPPAFPRRLPAPPSTRLENTRLTQFYLKSQHSVIYFIFFCNQTSNKYYLALLSFYKNKTDDTLSARGSDRRGDGCYLADAVKPILQLCKPRRLARREKARGKSLSFVLSWQKETNIEETRLRLGRVGEVAVT